MNATFVSRNLNGSLQPWRLCGAYKQLVIQEELPYQRGPCIIQFRPCVVFAMVSLFLRLLLLLFLKCNRD